MENSKFLVKFKKVLGALEPDARHMWESFGGNPMVLAVFSNFNQFI